uniref:Uncharacterized protein LOC114331017 n=1 Tax=Diabrotica virgifera virgifera TaxID=50390 RepID=A0A6P7FTJ4_DIAVI
MAGYRREYTLAEDKLILSWIVRIKAYYQLRGTRLWKDLEVAEIFEEDRTWHSLKNRFIKKPQSHPTPTSAPYAETHACLETLECGRVKPAKVSSRGRWPETKIMVFAKLNVLLVKRPGISANTAALKNASESE